jgi:hypothetical protein
MSDRKAWPELPLASWADTRATLHMWTQIVGKVRLALTPLVNHWWNVPLYPTARGLTTSAMFHGDVAVEIRLDLLEHVLEVITSEGVSGRVPLVAQSVAQFHARLMGLLRDLAVPVKIWTTPQEVPDPIPFERDEVHHSYDPAAAERFLRALLAATSVLGDFRTRFIGKASPVHFFWGGFDLAVTLFSGRRAPPRPEADRITREGYSHEVASFGFWPGSSGVDSSFYAYAAPEPPGFNALRLAPEGVRYDPGLRIFVLPYELVRQDPDPDARVLEFCDSVYEAAANLGGWDRGALERLPLRVGPEVAEPPPAPTVH